MSFTARYLLHFMHSSSIALPDPLKMLLISNLKARFPPLSTLERPENASMDRNSKDLRHRMAQEEKERTGEQGGSGVV